MSKNKKDVPVVIPMKTTFLSELVTFVSQRTFTGNGCIRDIMLTKMDTFEWRFQLLVKLLSFHKYGPYKLIDAESKQEISLTHIQNLLNQMSSHQSNPIIRKWLFEKLTNYLSSEYVEFMKYPRDYTHIAQVMNGTRSLSDIYQKDDKLIDLYSLVWASGTIYQWEWVRDMMSLKTEAIYDIFEAYTPVDLEAKVLIRWLTKENMKHMCFSMAERPFLVGAIKYFFFGKKWYVHYILSVFSGMDPAAINSDLQDESFKTLTAQAYDKYLEETGKKVIMWTQWEKVFEKDRFDSAIELLKIDNSKWLTTPTPVKKRGRRKLQDIAFEATE